MADKFYSVVLGGQLPSQVTEGGSTSGQAIEVRVNDTVYARKKEVILGVMALRDYLVTKETRPIA
ncbi:MAG: hypothetical protein ACREB3_01645 [Burkholderiales bacterium]